MIKKNTDIHTIDSLPDQLWMSVDRKEPPSNERMDPIGENVLPIKPKGGLWTSTYTPNAEFDSDWLRWCYTEGYIAGTYAFRLKVEPDLDIVEIRGMKDLRRVVDKYSMDEYKNRITRDHEYPIDFESMAEDYDAMRLTEEGQVDTRMPGMDEPDLYGWDSESTLWFNWCFTDVEYVGEYRDSREW